MINLCKKKLLVVCGAGASVEFGMPSVNDVNNLLSTELDKHFQIIGGQNKLYEFILNLSPTTDFENIIYRFHLLESLLNKTHPFYNLINLSNLPNISDIFNGNSKQLDSESLRNCISIMHDALVNEMRNRCRNIEINYKDELLHANSFFDNLSKKFEIGIINFNYDNVMLKSTRDLFTGFNLQNGQFEPEQTLNRKNFNFLYHIHGSVHFDLKGNQTSLHEIYWNHDLNSNFAQNTSGRNTIHSLEILNFPNSAFIAGYGKSIQMQRYPYRIYYSVLDQIIQEADSILFIGYGFKDSHLNTAFHNVRQPKKKRKIGVITRSPDECDYMGFRSDEWSFNLFNTIPGNAHEFKSTNGKFHPTVKEMRPNAIEYSANNEYPLFIWHHGFINACKNSDLIIKNLN